MSKPFEILSRILHQHADSGSKLTVKTFIAKRDEDEDQDARNQIYVLLEGDRKSLAFLADAIVAHLEAETCDLHLHPVGAVLLTSAQIRMQEFICIGFHAKKLLHGIRAFFSAPANFLDTPFRTS